MLVYIKEAFYEYLKSLGYNVCDSWENRSGSFPWLHLRTAGARVQQGRDFTTINHQFIVDIFSTYKGEKEILEIVDNISSHLIEFIDSSDKIHYASLNSLNIMDDNETGPARKHGIATFSFTLAQGAVEDED